MSARRPPSAGRRTHGGVTGSVDIAQANHFVFTGTSPAVAADGALHHNGNTYAVHAGAGPDMLRENGVPGGRRAPSPKRRPGSARSTRSARSARSTGTQGSRSSRASRHTYSGLLPEDEKRRESAFDARSTADERRRGVIPQYDALRDKNLPASLKDKLLRNAYAAQAHTREERTNVMASAARPSSASRRRPTSASRRPPSAGRAGRPARRPVSAGRRTARGGTRQTDVAKNTQAALEPVRARVAELWQELRIPERERDYYASRLFNQTDPRSVDTLMRLRDALEEHRTKTLQVLKCVDMREGQLERLKTLSEDIIRSGGDTRKSAELMATMSSLLSALRYSTFSCAEAVVEWRRGLCQPQAFLWKGMNYVLKMKDDMEVVDAASTRLHGSVDDDTDEFTRSRQDFTEQTMKAEESLQNALFEENDRLLSNHQWMPTVNLDPGQAKPKPITASGQGGTVPVPSGPEEEAQDEDVTATAEPSAASIDWDALETDAKEIFQTLDSVRAGVVSKQAMRRTLLKQNAGGGVKPVTKLAIDKLWRRLGSLYGKVAFSNVSWEEITLGLAACKGKPYDPRVVELPLLRSVENGQSASGQSPKTVLSYGVRVAFTEIFRRFDADHDGALAKGELNAFQRSVHGVALEPHTLNWIYSNHQVDKRGNLTLAGFLSCVYEQTVENEAAIVWELQQLGYGSREAGSGPTGQSSAPVATTVDSDNSSAVPASTVPAPEADPTDTPAPDPSDMSVPEPEPEPEPAKIEATAPSVTTDTSSTRAKTKQALLGGLRSGKLEIAVAKMEEDEAAAELQAKTEAAATYQEDLAQTRAGEAEYSDSDAPAKAGSNAQSAKLSRHEEEAGGSKAMGERSEEEFAGSDDGQFGFDRRSSDDEEYDFD